MTRVLAAAALCALGLHDRHRTYAWVVRSWRKGRRGEPAKVPVEEFWVRNTCSRCGRERARRAETVDVPGASW